MKITRAIALMLLLAAALFHNSALAAEPPFFNAEFIFDTIPGYPSCHGSTIAQTPNGDLFSAWYSGAAEKATDVAIYASRLAPGAKEWTKPEIIQDTKDLSDGNPVLFTAPDGKVWLYYVAIVGTSWNDCPVYQKVSSDNGLTWGAVETIRQKKGWMTRNKPLVLSDGRILLPLYDERVFQPHFYISEDNSKSWKYWGKIVQYQALQPTVIERADGSLFCMMRTGAKDADIWQSTSADKGKTWSKAEFSGLPNPGAAVDMVKLANGHVAIAFNDSRASRNPLTVAISEDEGRTWKCKRDIEGGDTQYSYDYPAIIQSKDGNIHVTYTWRRLHIKHAAFNEAWACENAK